MKPRYRSLLSFPVVIALLAGCSRAPGAPQGPSGASTDQAEVAATMAAADPAYTDDDVSPSSDPTDLATTATASGAGVAGTAGAQAAIQPLNFWRTFRSIERRFDFAFADTDTTGRPTTAIVTVHKTFLGSFNILVADQVPEGSPPAAHVLTKPLVDHGVRRVLLKRVPVPDPTSGRRAWRVVATSGVRITSRDAQTRIASLRIQSGALDTTVTEQLAFFRLRAILALEPLADVTLTATTGASDDVVLLYLRDRRVRFHANGDRTYTITFPAPDVDGLRHMGVNALAHATLYDDQAPYDSQSWIEPFIVHPLQLADGTPLD